MLSAGAMLVWRHIYGPHALSLMGLHAPCTLTTRMLGTC